MAGGIVVAAARVQLEVAWSCGGRCGGGWPRGGAEAHGRGRWWAEAVDGSLAHTLTTPGAVGAEAGGVVVGGRESLLYQRAAGEEFFWPCI